MSNDHYPLGVIPYYHSDIRALELTGSVVCAVSQLKGQGFNPSFGKIAFRKLYLSFCAASV